MLARAGSLPGGSQSEGSWALLGPQGGAEVSIQGGRQRAQTGTPGWRPLLGVGEGGFLTFPHLQLFDGWFRGQTSLWI